MVNANYARTKQGQAVLRKENYAKKFCVDMTKQAIDTSPDALSKLSSIHSRQVEEGKKHSENDMMQYTGVSVFPQGMQVEKISMREKNVEENMKSAQLRFALGVEKAKRWEAE